MIAAGSRLGPYEILGLWGAGGMGETAPSVENGLALVRELHPA